MATTPSDKLALIKQYRDSGMTYLDAAKAANTAVTTPSKSSPTAGTNVLRRFENTFNRQMSNLGADLNALESGDSNATVSPMLSNESGSNTAGGFVDYVTTQANSPTSATGKVAATSSTASSPTTTTTTNTGGTNTGTQGNKSTVAGGTTVNPNLSQETNLGRVGKDVTNTYVEGVADATKTKTDTTNVIDSAYSDMEKAKSERQLTLSIESMEEDARIKKEAEEDVKAANAKRAAFEYEAQSNIAYTEATNAAEENKVKVANEVALMQSNVNLAKLGLTLSTAGITQAQQIYTQGVLSLAELKTRNTYNVAKLKNDFAKTEFEHTTAVNKIISDAEDKGFKIRQDLSKSIYEIKLSMTMDKLSKQQAINKAVDDYQKARQDNQKTFIDSLGGINKTLAEKTTLLTNALKTKEAYANTKITTAVTSGTWSTLPASQRAQLEQEAGLPPGTVEKQINAQIGESIFKVLGDTGITEGDYVKAIQTARQLMETGISLETAVNRTLLLNPKYRALVAKKTAGKSSGGSSGKMDVGNYIDRSTGEPVSFYEVKGIPVNQDGTPVDISGYVKAGSASLGDITIKEPTAIEKLVSKVTGTPAKPKVTAYSAPKKETTTTTSWNVSAP